MKGLAKRLSLVICAAAVVFAGCGNPWMKRITASLYDKPVTPVPALPVLTVDPPTALIAKGDSQQFNASEPVTWTVEGVASAGTDISAAGLLTVALDETAAILTVRATSIVNPAVSGTAAVTVTEPVLPVLTNIADIETYLAAASGSPVDLLVDMDLSGSGWANLLLAIQGAGKTVNLNLSACTMSGAEFDPDNTNSTGKQYIAALVLPDAATSIKDGAYYYTPTFQHFDNLKSISGNGITDIGRCAFYDCNSLEEVSFPAATDIDSLAFSNCTALRSIYLPAAADIGLHAFYNCTSLEEVNLPAVTIIREDTFGNCTALTTVSFSASLTTIDNNPFSGCANLTSITVDPANPYYSGQGGMLLNKAGTTLIVYPSASGTVTLDSAITALDEWAFFNCTSLTTAYLPAVTNIGDYAFRECTGLTTVYLPVAQIIGLQAFRETALTTVDLPAAQTIGSSAFIGCSSLTSVSLPAATSIGYSAFVDCDSVTDITLGTVPPTTVEMDLFQMGTSSNITIHVPSGSVGAYTTWASTSAIISSFSPKTLTIAGDG
jgi:hypothetical protein